MYEESDYVSEDCYDSESDFDDEENAVVASKSKTQGVQQDEVRPHSEQECRQRSQKDKE